MVFSADLLDVFNADKSVISKIPSNVGYAMRTVCHATTAQRWSGRKLDSRCVEGKSEQENKMQARNQNRISCHVSWITLGKY